MRQYLILGLIFYLYEELSNSFCLLQKKKIDLWLFGKKTLLPHGFYDLLLKTIALKEFTKIAKIPRENLSSMNIKTKLYLYVMWQINIAGVRARETISYLTQDIQLLAMKQMTQSKLSLLN